MVPESQKTMGKFVTYITVIKLNYAIWHDMSSHKVLGVKLGRFAGFLQNFAHFHCINGLKIFGGYIFCFAHSDHK